MDESAHSPANTNHKVLGKGFDEHESGILQHMKPMPGQLAQFLGNNITYIVPPFQRPYQWGELQWYEIVLNTIDLMQKPKNLNNLDRSHWMGIQLVAAPETPINLGMQTWELIDGQQRLITLISWLHALRDHARDMPSGEKAANPLEHMAKVNVQKSDQVWFEACLKGLWRSHYDSEVGAHGPLKSYVYFRFLLWAGHSLLDQDEPPKYLAMKRNKANATLSIEEYWGKRLEADQILALPISGPEALQMIQITLRQFSWLQLQREPLDAAPAELFRALNGDGLKLRPFDFVRNMLFVRLPAEKAQQIYADKWELAEKSIFEATWTGKRFDAPSIFLYDFLIANGASAHQGPINRARGNEHFAVHIAKLTQAELADYLETQFVPAMHSWLQVVTARPSASDSLRNLLHETRTLSAGPLDPALLYIVELIRVGKISVDEAARRIKVLQAIVVRMILSGQPLNNLRSKIMNVMPILQDTDSLQSWSAAIDAIGWASDIEVLAQIETVQLYGAKATPRQLLVLFRGAEQELAGMGANLIIGGKEPSQFSIEHLLPSSIQDHWRDHLQKQGFDYEAAYALKDTLGNLTPLTNEHNKKMQTKLLTQKADCMIDATILGYQEPPLRLHDSWAKKGKEGSLVWNEAKIRNRSTEIAKLLLKHWSR